MTIFSFEFLILLVASFVLFYLVGLLNKTFKRTIVPQWSILLIASLVFYGFNNWIYLAFIGGSSLVSYIFALLCQYKLFNKDENGKTKFKPTKVVEVRKGYENLMCAFSIIINVSVLVVLKYFNFFSNGVASLFHFTSFETNFIIPLGISFYTLSLISYNVDIKRRISEAELNPLKFLLFVSYFPKVLQGPISTYDKLKEDGLFNEHRFLDVDYLKSFYRIAIGLIKKIVIANVLGLYVNSVYLNLDGSFGINLILTTFLYSIQLYCDFSGFMDIAIGVSGLFGIKLEENFDTPYLSSSIQEFWRRWHITLGNWLKKYIYIPLGGNRVSTIRWIINILIVWLVSGLWHGANWTFIVWGLMHALLIIITGLPRQIKKAKQVEKNRSLPIRIVGTILTFLFVNLSWVFFRASNIQEAFRYIYQMVQVWVPSSYSIFADPSLSKAHPFLIVSIAFVAILIYLKFIKLPSKSSVLAFISKYALTIVFISLSIFVFIYLNSIGGGVSSFIYFDF
ncbi:MAG: MBOAT family protein [Bacilli bacterium]|nr:MBOAT family protein [Bacilli bacterium]